MLFASHLLEEGGRGYTMRVFRIEDDDCLVEYPETPFDEDHEERILENWL